METVDMETIHAAVDADEDDCNLMVVFADKIDDLPQHDPIQNNDQKIQIVFPGQKECERKDELLDWMLQNCNQIESIVNLSGKNVDMMAAFDHLFPNLISLHFKNICTATSMETLLARFGPQLELLRFEYMNLSKLKVDHDLPRLKHLAFSNCEGNICLSEMLTKSANSLTHLCLKDFRKLSFEEVGKNKLAKVTHIRMENSKFRTIRCLNNLLDLCADSLTSLYLVGCDITSLANLSCDLLSLSKVILLWCDHNGCDDGANMNHQGLNHLMYRCSKSLKVLCISRMNHDCFYEEHNYAELEYELAGVTHLAIEQCYGDGLHCLVSKCRQSLKLLLIERDFICFCVQMPFDLPCLEVLILKNCIDCDGIESLVEKSANTLRFLVIEDMRKVVNIPKKGVALPSLEGLYLLGASFPDMENLLASCSSTLKVLHLMQSQHAPESDGYLPIVKQSQDTLLPALKQLSVSPTIDGDVLKKLETWCPKDVTVEHKKVDHNFTKADEFKIYFQPF